MTNCVCCSELVTARIEGLIGLRVCALQARRQPAALPAQSATMLGENDRSVLAACRVPWTIVHWVWRFSPSLLERRGCLC